MYTKSVENKSNKSESENLDENHNYSSKESDSVDDRRENSSSDCNTDVRGESHVDKATIGGQALPDRKTLSFKTKKKEKLERFY